MLQVAVVVASVSCDTQDGRLELKSYQSALLLQLHRQYSFSFDLEISQKLGKSEEEQDRTGQERYMTCNKWPKVTGPTFVPSSNFPNFSNSSELNQNVPFPVNSLQKVKIAPDSSLSPWIYWELAAIAFALNHNMLISSSFSRPRTQHRRCRPHHKLT